MTFLPWVSKIASGWILKPATTCAGEMSTLPSGRSVGWSEPDESCHFNVWMPLCLRTVRYCSPSARLPPRTIASLPYDVERVVPFAYRAQFVEVAPVCVTRTVPVELVTS